MLDLNKDGVVSEEEFCEFFENTDPGSLNSESTPPSSLLSRRELGDYSQEKLGAALAEPQGMREKATSAGRKGGGVGGGGGSDRSFRGSCRMNT